MKELYEQFRDMSLGHQVVIVAVIVIIVYVFFG